MKASSFRQKLMEINPVCRWTFLVFCFLCLFFWFSLPDPLFRDPTSTVVFDRNGRLLGARISDDGQWRFPENKQVPEKFRSCILNYEDRYFNFHPGVNLVALLRAAKQNISAGRIVSGGSTITMQTIRLSRKGKPRTIIEKIIEMWLALRLELTTSKSGILGLYASHAPFGGNVVGLDAAAWRYFGRSSENLSWAEAATLAVLPNSPGLIHPGRNRSALEQKRNRLLNNLLHDGIIDTITCSLAKEEPLPRQPFPLPANALHLVNRMWIEHKGENSFTTIDGSLQKRVGETVERHHLYLSGNDIHNAAVMVMNVKNGEVLAYIGNTQSDSISRYGNEVDVITSPRSSGSILKPLLFAAMLDEGELLPGTLVADIPTTINNFVPKNFKVTYDGAVPAREALIRSLNIPSVRLLGSYGLERFYTKLKDAGFGTIRFPAEHYGLSLILGGAEVTLWDLCKVYQGLANTLLFYSSHFGEYPDVQFHEPVLLKDHINNTGQGNKVFSAGAIYCTFDAMKDVRRPEAETGWESFLSSFPVAWKTGTSFGFRDAWAVGVTPDWLVGVWAGNADGEGRPGLTGISVAAPLMFEVFGLLRSVGWFDPPWDELVKIPVCRQSGMRPSVICPETDSILVPATGLETHVCRYHTFIHLDKSGQYRVHAGCYPPSEIITLPWFHLPPAMEWYYRSRNPFYKSLPPWLEGCNEQTENPMQLIWPVQETKIFIPRELDGSLGQVVFEAAHTSRDMTVYWYIDENFIGTTQNQHKLTLQPAPGKHILTLMDDDGNVLKKAFEIVGTK